MKSLLKVSLILLILILSINLNSCKEQDQHYIEGEQLDITGSWKIIEARQNGNSLIASYDFSGFRLNFNENNTYTIDNPLPFMVTENGDWQFNDPFFPTEITMNHEDGSQSYTTNFGYPLDGSRRLIHLTFDVGCISNEYEYTLERVTE